MRVGSFSFFASFFALPLSYLPYKYLDRNATHVEKQHPKTGYNLQEERKIRLETPEWLDWIENVVGDNENLSERKSSKVDIQALIVFFASYVFLKVFSKVTRTFTVIFLALISM